MDAIRERWSLAGAAAPATEIGSHLFEKEILRVGSWVHPLTKKVVSFTRDRLAHLAENFKRMTGQQIDVVVPDGHSYKAVDNKGFVRGMRVDGDKLVGVFEIPDEAVARQLGGTIRGVSASIDPDFVDRQGNHLGAAIEHVALTPYPVVTGQDNFIRLTASDGAAVEVIQLEPVQEESGMDKSVEQLAAELETGKQQLAAQEAEYKTQLAARDAELRTFKLAAVEAEITGLLADGKICASDKSKNALRVLLSADDVTAPKLQLSTKGADGKEVIQEFSPAAAMRDFLAELPKGCVVNLSRITGTATADTDEEKKAQEEADKFLQAGGHKKKA
jgi:hypothetical protein